MTHIPTQIADYLSSNKRDDVMEGLALYMGVSKPKQTDRKEIITEAIRIAAEQYNTTRSKILERTRKREIAIIRHQIFYCLHKTFGMGHSEIGRYFGLDHSTVIHGIRRVRSDLVNYKRTRRQVTELMSRFQTELDTTVL